MKLIRAILFIAILTPLCFADQKPYIFSIIPQEKDRLFKYQVDTTFTEVYDKLGTKVDTYSDQTIGGAKTFSESATFSETITASSATITNTLTANEVTTTYGFFHDRGDPTAYDFTLASGLVTNGTWQDLDLSSIVPAGAKTVALYVDITDDAASAYIYFRKKGNSNEKNISLLIAPVANIGSYADIIVPLSTARVVEYKTNNVTFTGINITVKGWWK